MNRSGRRKGFELAAALLAAILASATLYAFGAAPPPRPQEPTPVTKAAPGRTFASACTASTGEDTRPDPAWIAASFESDNCWAPPMPAPLDGYAATREQIVAGMAAAKTYLIRSDAYQKCIGDFVAAHHARAGKSFLLVENHRLLVSENDKKKVDNRIKTAIDAFNEYGSECTQ